MTRREKDKKALQAPVSRRKVLKGMAVGATAVAFPLVLTPRKARAAIKLTMRDPGGPYEKAMGEAFYKPFNEMMKGEVVVTGVIGKHEPTSMIKTMVDTKTYTWDMAGGLSKSAHDLLVKGSFLEKLEIEDSPHVQEIPDHFRTPYILGNEVFTTILAYRTDVYPKKARAPTGGWKDLWNVSEIPGVRAMRKHAFDTSELALMADGVAPTKVYDYMRKNGFDPVYKSLDKIKPHIDIWWTGGAQTSQLLATGEVDMIPTWNARAQAAIDGGAPAKLSWNQSLWTFGGLTVLRDGPHVDLCRKFIEFCAKAERQATFAKYIAYGPTNPNAYKHIAPDRAAVLSTAPDLMAQSSPIDSTFWGSEKEKAMERFTSWLIA